MPSSNLLCECCVPINGAKSSEMDLLWGKCSEAELSEYIHCLNLYPEPTNDQLLVCRAVGNTTLSFLQKIQTFLICFSCRCTGHTSASGPGPFFFGCLCRELIFSYPSCELVFCISWVWISQKGHWQTNYLGLFPAHVFPAHFNNSWERRKIKWKIQELWVGMRGDYIKSHPARADLPDFWFFQSVTHWTEWSNARNLQNYPLKQLCRGETETSMVHPAYIWYFLQ